MELFVCVKKTTPFVPHKRIQNLKALFFYRGQTKLLHIFEQDLSSSTFLSIKNFGANLLRITSEKIGARSAPLLCQIMNATQNMI
jgi:hypothetical protein